MDSTPEQTAEGVAVVRVLAAVLERLVNANAHLAQGETQVTKFHALRAPSISILQYLERIHKYASCSTESFILALIYLDRLIQRNNFLLTQLNAHRVIISAVLVAAKFFDDAYYNNAYYAKVGGVTVSELNSLEVEFLFRINFALRVSPELYRKYHEELLSHAVATNSSDEVAVMLAAAAHLANPSPLAVTEQQCVNAASACQAPTHVHSTPWNHLGNSEMIIVGPTYENEVQHVITPSSITPSPSIPFYGQTQPFVVGPVHHMHHHHQVTNNVCSLSEEYVSNLATQLHHHRLHQHHQTLTFPPRAVSATVSLCDVDEAPSYKQQQQNSQFVRHHFTAYPSSSASTTPSLTQTSGSCSTQGHPIGYRHPLPQQQHHHQARYDIVESVYVAGGGD